VRSLTGCGDFRSAEADPDSHQRRDEVHHSRVRTNAGVLLTGRLVLPSAIINDGAVVLDGDRIAFAGKASELPQ
jgi:hypothetical protein